MPNNKLTKVLFQDKANRYCADCHKFLLEVNEIHASFFPLSFHIDERWTTRKNWIQTKYGKNFVELHEYFTPDGFVPSTTCAKTTRKALSEFIDSCRNERISLKSIAHGVFVCKVCAEVHGNLGANITKVKLTSDISSWSEQECNEIQDKGNYHGNNILEKFMPDEWVMKKENKFENKLEREVFIRYKYEILDFLLPKERWGYKKFMKKSNSATKKWKRLVDIDERDVDWAIYTLAYRDYSLRKTNENASSSSSTASKLKKTASLKKTSSLKKKNKVPVEVANEAERILQDARQKQIYFINAVIKIQSFVRMALVAKKYRWKNNRHNHNHIPKHPHRRYTHADVLRNTVKIQSRTRSFLVRRSFCRKRSGTVLLQARYRGRRVRLLFLLTKGIIITIQAFIRGCIVRNKVHTVMKARSEAYQSQIINLWERSYTPLTYRTKFWMHTNHNNTDGNGMIGFTTFISQENELVRLWKLLGFDFKKYDMKMKPSNESILSDAVYVKYTQVDSFLKNPNFQCPVNYESKGEAYELLDNCAKRVQLERVQIYERLFLLRYDVNPIYERANIKIDEKFKKVKLSKSIWNYSWQKSKSATPGEHVFMKPEVSASIFDELFPELRQDANMRMIMPSKKGMERLGLFEKRGLPIPLSLEGTTMHFKSNLDQQIITNLAEISRNFVKGVRHLVLTGTMNTDIENIMIGKRQQRQLEAMDSSKYSLAHQFVHKSYE